mmetsp:Transcript_34633/g.111737  ORF Transcript_34633/g.111737 Transcript_34633/m.111737 type:complete len:218 (+) Transcript_34633:366-1019(+)
MASGRRVADVAVQVERPRRRLEFEKPAPAALSRRAVRALDLERSQHDSPEESQSGVAELGASAESRRRHARHRNLCLPVRSRRGGGVGVDGDRAYETPAGARGVRRRGVARGDQDRRPRVLAEPRALARGCQRVRRLVLQGGGERHLAQRWPNTHHLSPAPPKQLAGEAVAGGCSHQPHRARGAVAPGAAAGGALPDAWRRPQPRHRPGPVPRRLVE